MFDDDWNTQAFIDLIAPPRLVEVVRAIGGETTLLFGNAQPRVVPGPEDDGGYCSWHRDTGGPLREDGLWV